MMARSSTASLENVNRIGVCIIAGGRDRSMRTLRCHVPLLSVASGVLNTYDDARASPLEKRTSAHAMAAVRTMPVRAEERERRFVMTHARYIDSFARRTPLPSVHFRWGGTVCRGAASEGRVDANVGRKGTLQTRAADCYD